uniref:Uncharacterized protein n=1 Tax=Romanomermis culicivorax TaxID=13658 RepID=A0A915KY83_ROMCU
MQIHGRSGVERCRRLVGGGEMVAVRRRQDMIRGRRCHGALNVHEVGTSGEKAFIDSTEEIRLRSFDFNDFSHKVSKSMQFG